MLRLIRAFFYDGVSWLLLVVLMVTVVFSITSWFNRYDQLERYKATLWQLRDDIEVLEKELDRKEAWAARLEDDPEAWERVAREKMNYVGPDEVLVTFVSK